ncbi:CbiX/SirB N-terminal domain-containing protein [Luteococcus sp. H138]|uniref:sirohydrochlorin chelatase n=1 Tax=unclassified Luteococcus TaxID=2639923 RepID=UPI00313CEACA
MTAPALILLAHGSAQPEMTSTIHQLRMQMQQSRRELNIGLAFLDKCPPSGPAVVSALAARGVKEMVFVPLDLTHAVEVCEQATGMLERVRALHPQVAMTLARPLGPATDLLNVLDARLREALRQTHAVELDGLVLSAPEAGDTRGNALLARRARQWSAHHKLPCVVACNDGSGANVAQAVAALRSQGRRHVAVGSFYISADENYHAMRESALAAGVEAVSAPMGDHEFILDLVMARYVFAAMELLDAELPQNQQLDDEAHHAI